MPYPRYDITKKAVDPKGMTDAELKKIVDDLDADIKDVRSMAYKLTEDLKKRRSLVAVYRSFWNAREEGRMPGPKYTRRWFSLDVFQRVMPWLTPGTYDMGIFGELQVFPNPKPGYVDRWMIKAWTWVLTPGPYRRRYD